MKTIAILVLCLVGQDDPNLKAEEKKADRYRRILEKNPEDPEAAYQLGRHLCFFLGDWTQGLPLLAKGKDKDLAQLARYDLGTDELPSDPKAPLTGAAFDFGSSAAPDLVIGDMFWDLMKKYKDVELRNIMNRAIYRYRMSLSKVDEAKKRKLLDRVSKVMDRFRAMYTHPGKVTEGAPKGWGVVVGKGEKIEGVATDESRSRTGRGSFKISPAKAGLVVTERKPITPGEYTLSFWYMAEGTVAPDLFAVWLFDKSDACHVYRTPMPPDRGELPVWNHVEMKVKSDAEILFFRLYVDNVGMREGTIWIDDLSLRGGPKNEELVLNGGFEER